MGRPSTWWCSGCQAQRIIHKVEPANGKSGYVALYLECGHIAIAKRVTYYGR